MPRYRQQETRTVVSHLRANASWDGFTAGEDTQVAVYNPPAGWVVLDTQVIIHSTSNGSRAVSTLAGGLNLVSETIIEAVYKDAIRAAGNYKDKSIKANIEREREERKKDIRKFQTNKNTVHASAQAKAHGSFADRKRGWDEFSVNATLLYVGEPSSAAIAQEIEQAYRIDIHRFSAGLFDQEIRKIVMVEKELHLVERCDEDVMLDVTENAPDLS